MLVQRTVLHDARVQREAHALSEAGYDVRVLQLATASSPLPRNRTWSVTSVAEPPPTRRLPRVGRRAVGGLALLQALRRQRPQVVHAHDIAMLAPSWLAGRKLGARIVYDTHELATGVPYRGRLANAGVRSLEAALVPRCDAVVTVSEGIASRLYEDYGLANRPAVVRNTSLPRGRAGSGSAPLRAALGIGSAPLMLHQGDAGPGRGGEELVRALALVQDVQLAFLGSHGTAARARLESIAGAGRVADRVHFVPAVGLDVLLDWTADADAGLSLLQPNCENHRLALPNKVFEYIAAGVPVIASRTNELERLVRVHGVGWTVDATDPVDIARGIRSAVRQRQDPALAARLDEAASTLSWEREKDRLLAVYERLVPR